ncbi:unnamed protein product [Parnassius mnemosyne]|uniref:RNA-directed DNA polymerase n=1 Tax=Parnassius mnemosyne TaxID=213953 RepID=A0AAV1LF01_9NEOP
MVDTGSTRSFISPRKAYQHFYQYITHEPFEVVSTHASSRHDEVIEIPLPPTFKSSDFHKFYLYDVDSRYDGLIGNDLLKQLDTIIDLKDLVLKTKTTCIPIVNNNLNYVITLPPRSERRVKLPTDQCSGEAIINYKEFVSGVRMPSALVNCVNGYAATVIQNVLDKEMILTVTRPFTVTKYDMTTQCDINVTSTYSDLEIDKVLEDNLLKLRLNHTNDEERDKIFRLCQEFKDIFYCDKLPLTFANEIKHKIRTKNEDPIYVRPYRQAPMQVDEINRQVDKLLKDNVIQESHSPWNAPVHLVPKKMDASGEIKFRMVIDYRRLNDITIDDKYPLPNITDLFDKLGKSSYFSTIDLASGYHQIEIEEQDRQKTAFSTQNGHYEFLRMPFGLKTAPATFQRTMDSVLRGLQGIHCMVYLDDIIVFSTSLEEHIQKLRTIFDRIRATNLKVQLDKSEFLRKEVLYLGHTITKEGLRPNTDKINAVLNFPIPKTTTEIKSFLGLVGYYRRFIKDFAKITQPLTACLKKRNKITIDEKYINAFEKCKEILTSVPLLQYPDFDKTFILTTDASNIALGAVLSQGPIGSDRPVAYASRTLSDTESRYSTIERELLAVIWAVKHFRPYLYGRKFVIYTDHRPLVWLYSLKEPNSKLTRWRLRLQEYDFEIIYKNGKQNTNADALSRIKVNALNSDDEGHSMDVNFDSKEYKLREHLKDVVKEIEKLNTQNKRHNDTTSIVTISDSSTVSASPMSLSDTISICSSEKVSEYPIRSPSESSKSQTVHSAVELESNGIPILHEAIDTKPNQILIFSWFKNEYQVKDISREKQKVLEVFLPLDNSELIKEFLKKYIRPKIKYFIYFERKEHRRQFSNIIIHLFKKDMVQFYECTERVIFVEDEKEQRAIVIKYHEGKTCHRGIKETLVRIRRNYYWDNLQETVSAIINSCTACKKMKYDRKPIKPILQLTQTQDAPFQEIFIDLFNIEGKHYLTLIDAFSKLGQAIEIANRSTPEVVRALMKYFSFYGIPKKISSDPGSEFNNELIKEFLSFYKIEQHIGTPNSPSSMGIIERFHSTIIEVYRLAKYERKPTDAASVMTYSVLAYNNTIHSVTELTPFEVVFGHTDTGSPFNTEFDKQYLQHLVRDHAKRTKFLYKYLAENMVAIKEKIRKKKGGEDEMVFQCGKTIFAKDTNKRKSKDKPRYVKAKVVGKVERNIVPIQIGERKTKAPIKNIKRPPQVVHTDDCEADPGPSSAVT